MKGVPEREKRMTEAVRDVKEKQLSIRQAADKYNVPISTLCSRLHGAKPRYLVGSHTHRLTACEEQALIDYALDMDFLGHPLSIAELTNAANYLLMQRNSPLVKSDWASRFLKRSPALSTRLSRFLDYDLALSDKLRAWFKYFSELKEKYNVLEEDIYNMDETGFQMGIIESHVGVTDAARVDRGMHLQPGTKEWVTAIACISGAQTEVPPVIIFRAVNAQKCWNDCDLPGNWRILVSQEGLTNNSIALQWIKHFNENTPKVQGRYRMLILDGHVTHSSEEFVDYCEQNKIILAYLPPHSSHRAQPLDVGCFRPLKHHYSNQVRHINRVQSSRITKTQFLVMFREAYNAAMSGSNIKGAFTGAGLVPFNSEAVLSKLRTRRSQSKISEQSRQPQSLARVQSEHPHPPAGERAEQPRLPDSQTTSFTPLPPPLPEAPPSRTPSPNPPSDIPSSSSISEEIPQDHDEIERISRAMIRAAMGMSDRRRKKTIVNARRIVEHSKALYHQMEILRNDCANKAETLQKLYSGQIVKGLFTGSISFDVEEGNVRLHVDEAINLERESAPPRHCNHLGHSSRTCPQSVEQSQLVKESRSVEEGRAEPANSDTFIDCSLDELRSSPPPY